MNVLLVMIPLSLVLLGGAVIAFFWAVNHDQFDDMDAPGLIPLDDAPRKEGGRQ
jgi:cbb3-type cytochrome oxidase maturation protein